MSASSWKVWLSCLYIAAVVHLVAPHPVRAAGFDCAKASGNVERLICTDSAVSDLDGKLNSAYKSARAAADAGSKDALTKEQRDWRRYARDLCQDSACLIQAYTSRIAVLTRNEKYIINSTSCEPVEGSSQCMNFVSYRDPQMRIASFNQTLHEQQKSGKIIGCTMLFNQAVGTAHGNNTFGGYCILEDHAKRTNVKICNDDMIGKFGLEPVEPAAEEQKALIAFTALCPGG